MVSYPYLPKTQFFEPYPKIYSVVRSSPTNCTSVEPSVHFPNQTFPRSLRKYKQKPHGANKTSSALKRTNLNIISVNLLQLNSEITLTK